VQGELGMRTVHQSEAKAQMVLRWQCDPEAEPAEAGDALPAVSGAGAGVEAGGDDASAPGRAARMLGEEEEEADVLPLPSLMCADGTTRAPLPPLEQAAVLAAALGVRKGRAADELRAWDMAPYVEAVRAQPRGAPVLRAAADLLAARHERTRGRTRMRALSCLEALADALRAPLPPVAARACFAWAAWLPPVPALRRELGEQLLSAGLVGAAMAMFEALELWDALIVCLQLAGKRAEAGALIRERLVATPLDARLWCALGDATGEEVHYRKAWEVSDGHSARAQRSLARAASSRAEYPAAVAAWEAALAINPMYPEGWFGLGYACMKTGDERRALSAFSRVTAQEPENGEAWNNVAALSLSAGRDASALAALQECVKHKRDAWPVWDNLATVAARCSAWSTAANAAATLLRLTSGKRAPEQEVLAGLVGAVEALGTAASPLATQVGAVLQAAAGGGAASADTWALYARFRSARGDTTGAAECLARRLRALQDGAWDRERAAFDAYVDASVALAEAHIAHGAQRDLAGVRLQLRGALKRAAESFADTQPHARLTDALARVSAREDELRAAAAGDS
jgi:tetratricopeptide (TPR) repeat protein